MQQWFSLFGPAADDAFHDSASIRPFGGGACEDTIPDETTIVPFRPLLEEYRLI
jgi:transposase, IS5 family